MRAIKSGTGSFIRLKNAGIKSKILEKYRV